MIRFGSLFAGLLLAAAAPAMAAPGAARTVEGWDLSASGRTCTMSSTFADDVTIGLIWSPETGNLAFMAAVPRAFGPGGDKAALELKLDGEGPYTEWEDKNAAVIEGKDTRAVIADWGPDHADDLAKSVGSASRASIRVGDRELGSYDVSGSAAAYRELRRCGETLASR